MTERNTGFIKLHRKIMDWGWYQNPNTCRLFIHCLLKANFQEKEWEGIKVPIGSFVTSYGKLATELKTSIQTIRTALNHLKLTHELTIKTTANYTVITVNNYVFYQSFNTQINNQLTNNQQTINKRLTTTKERKKGIKEEIIMRREIIKKLQEEAEGVKG